MSYNLCRRVDHDQHMLTIIAGETLITICYILLAQEDAVRVLSTL